jgi:tetratricopeptide (TPR) repeat protein
MVARLLRAQIRRIRGENAEAIAHLENIRQNKPAKFVNDEEARAWFFAHRLLGDLYVDDKADQAVLCYKEFLTSDHAGADTYYRLGRAYEALGDSARAARCYETVTGYEQHPLYYEARDALDRVKRGLGSPT